MFPLKCFASASWCLESVVLEKSSTWKVAFGGDLRDYEELRVLDKQAVEGRLLRGDIFGRPKDLLLGCLLKYHQPVYLLLRSLLIRDVKLELEYTSWRYPSCS
jgi:hypothetical protein